MPKIFSNTQVQINMIMSKYWRREWSVRNARWLHRFYEHFIVVLRQFKPLLPYLPITPVERFVKGIMFDCTMCGTCRLGMNGMSCPQNCPKNLSNGPCGGVRPGGYCEVKEFANMPCVFYLGEIGKRNMGYTKNEFIPPLNHDLKGSSSWLKEI